MNNTEIVNSIKTISTAELKEKLKSRESFEFWNVLTAEYYSNENIEGSRHVSLDRIGRDAEALNLPENAEIIVYCSGPGCPQSDLAAEKLRTFGYTNVKLYKGGLEEWEAAGLPVVPGIAEHEKGVADAKVEGVSCH